MAQENTHVRYIDYILRFVYVACCLRVTEIKDTRIGWTLYWWDTWRLTLTKERRLRVFENRVLWRIFGLL
jgi:hypothetical protein